MSQPLPPDSLLISEAGQHRLRGAVTSIQVGIVAGSVRISASTESADAQVEVRSLHGRPIELSLQDGVLLVRHPHVRWDGLRDTVEGLKEAVLGVAKREDRADLHLTVPAGVDLRCSTVAADVECRGLTGHSTIRCVGGSISCFLVAGSGRQTLRSVSGDLTVALPPKVGYRLNARSVSGAMEVDGRDVAARPGPPQGEVRSGDESVRITATSVSGALRLTRYEPA